MEHSGKALIDNIKIVYTQPELDFYPIDKEEDPQLREYFKILNKRISDLERAASNDT